MKYDKLLEGKVAVITSGAHGMGKHVAVIYARHGATCIINGRSPTGEETAEMLREISPDSCFIQCDMSKKDDVDSFIAQVRERTDKIDILNNVVGINNREPIAEITDENFAYTQEVNLRGIIRLTRGFWPALQKARGNIIFISTIHACSTFILMGGYASSKSATNAFARALAVEGAPYGIRANVICPGGTFSGRAEEYYKNETDPEKLVQFVSRGGAAQPDYGPGSSTDMANASLFLGSDLASHVTGAVVMADGGAAFQSHRFFDFRTPPDVMDLWREFSQDRYAL